ncbi:PREDICTED: syntaxin-1A-like isoform X2 [Amphimedon queenslandica]|nr:PREDICTED: syntaxin-1A-like isoform X2 [Amphimedon queenslandica]|eukprot:XP_011405383.2 PREDICTED: syntaxin-1A-like isoform X2 [Amphimedon queenslandica]
MLTTIDSLSENITKIDSLIRKIANNYKIPLPKENDLKENKRIQEEIKDLSHSITDELKRMKVSLDKEGTGPERNSAEYRIRRAQYSSISRKFQDVMIDYNKEEEAYRERNKQMIQRQVQITSGKPVSDEKLEQMLEEDNTQIFAQSIIGDIEGKRRMLSEVEVRHMEIKRLEENIRELHDMFYDLGQLVYEQGDMINNIEYNIEHAAAYVEKGQQNIRAARDYKRKNNRVKCYICCIVTTIIVVILIAILIAVAIGASYLQGRL